MKNYIINIIKLILLFKFLALGLREQNKFKKKTIEYSFAPKFLNKTSMDVYEVQLKSKKQNSSHIEKDEIKHITLQKGGLSLLNYRSVLEGYPGKEEEKMIYSLGSLGQLVNDIFDIHKDHQDNIKTLATTETKMDNLRKILEVLLNETLTLVKQTDFPKKNKNHFMRFICLAVSTGFVCLDFLEKNEKSTNNIFSINDYNRKDLICDMEKPRNLTKALIYYTKLSTKIQ